MKRILIGTLALAAAGTTYAAWASTEPQVVLECVDSAGRRVGWAERASQCPPGSTAFKYLVPEACGDGSCMPCDRLDCTPGEPGCPRPVPVEYLCCLPVCGEQACGIVNSAVECYPDNLIFDCACPYQHPNGDVECMEC